MLNQYEILGVKSTDSLQEIKTKFYQLAMENHPDRGGDAERMKELNAAYAWMRENHGSYTTVEREHVRYDVSAELLALAVKVWNMQKGLDVSIAGAWIWVVGDTKPIKDTLKVLNFRWAPKKCAWYFAGCRSSSRGKYTLDQIFNAYGRRAVTARDSSGNVTVAAGLLR